MQCAVLPGKCFVMMINITRRYLLGFTYWKLFQIFCFICWQCPPWPWCLVTGRPPQLNWVLVPAPLSSCRLDYVNTEQTITNINTFGLSNQFSSTVRRQVLTNILIYDVLSFIFTIIMNNVWTTGPLTGYKLIFSNLSRIITNISTGKSSLSQCYFVTLFSFVHNYIL